MDRTPKYRAWDKKQKSMWNVGAIHFDEGTVDLWRIEWCENLGRDGKVSNFGLPFKDVILMEYTGRKDYYGVEIYEGNIVDSVWGIAEIIFNDGAFEFKGENNHNHLHANEINERKIKIIGIIHEEQQ